MSLGPPIMSNAMSDTPDVIEALLDAAFENACERWQRVVTTGKVSRVSAPFYFTIFRAGWDAALAAAEAVPWIPVSERLPPDGVLVVTALPNGHVWHGFHSPTGWAQLCEPEEDYDAVPTHWMPRPTPPNAAAQEPKP